MPSVTGLRALVTGASSGIGAATSDVLAAKGATVLRTARTITGPSSFACDLAIDVSALASWAGDVDLLVLNAGLGHAGPFAAMPPGRIAELFTVNVVSQLELARALLPGMISRRRGHIVLVSSIAGAMGVADEAVYSATKAALRTFADALRLEVPAMGVTVVHPGVIDTPFFDRRGTPYTRRRPRPLPPVTVAEALVSAIEHNRPEIFVPSWLRFPARLNGFLPSVVRVFQRRFG
ncbi:SDR family NAD(P)-dependent oxidoreductase [Kutzneria chonburiensis]|uniref:SDR family NAD(P)-dependent oxidoreductase n=1 Tax=Kutzneria chonburiensis TaxID=1483604 RepID=A0ABV6N0V4_9PSEU|nr:SDR family NAD(P)-dependent oxidoreductase [Kutzneria chonburiensis]